MPPASDPLADSFDDKDDPYSANSDIWRIEATVAPRDIAFTIHDAKNMLGVISANVAYLAESIELTETGSGAGAALDDLRAATERASALLREALDSLRGSSRRGTAPAGVRVAPVVGASVARSRRRAEALGVRLEMREIHDQRVPIEPDLLEPQRDRRGCGDLHHLLCRRADRELIDRNAIDAPGHDVSAPQRKEDDVCLFDQ